MDDEEAEAADDDEYRPEMDDASTPASTPSMDTANVGESESEDENENEEEGEEEEANNTTLKNNETSANKSADKDIVDVSDDEEEATERDFGFRLPANFFPLTKVDSTRKFGYGIGKTGNEKGRIWLETPKDKKKIYIFNYFSLRSDASRYVCGRCSKAGKHTMLELQQGPDGVLTMMEDTEHVGDCLHDWKDYQNNQEICQRYIDRR